MNEALIRARKIRDLLPAGGLFHEKSWRVSPEAFELPAPLVEPLEKLGYRLRRFVRACNDLYHLSAKGRQPRWIAELLDAGKPPELVELQRERSQRNEIPRVIRPDLILTERGFAIAELDNVPGGIGLTAWLNRVYSENTTADILGGREGMLDGFASIFPGGDIVVSEESATYRPEMEWLARELNARVGETRWQVRSAEAGQAWSERVYRFFELFDLANVPAAAELRARVFTGETRVTPPFKPALEEKLWLGLFWMKPLEEYWRRALGDRTMRALREHIPYTWLIQPGELPVHAVIPRLEISSWEQATRFTQRQRELVIKVSGFSDQAWGARGVTVGHDVSQREWTDALHAALGSWPNSPQVMQVFHSGAVFTQPYLADDGHTLIDLKGRVRLCPYFFVEENETRLGGALATLVPADKKLIHGMTDAILSPTAWPLVDN